MQASVEPRAFPAAPSPSLSLPRRIRYLAEYVPLRLVTGLLSVLPRSAAMAVGRAIGRVVNFALGKRLLIARRNLMESFPGLSASQADDITRRSWENLGEGLAEFSRLPRMSDQDLLDFVEPEGLERLRESQKAGKGVLIVTAHYGAWEVGAKFWPYCGLNFAVVARRIKNPYVDAYVTRVRQSHGVRVIPARDGVREALRWLRQGNVVAVLIDHRIPEGGLRVPLFGRPASTTSLPAILALRYGIPVHPVRCWRRDGKVVVTIDPSFDFSGLSANEEGIYEATLRLNRMLERWITDRPEAWLWIHNRWK